MVLQQPGVKVTKNRVRINEARLSWRPLSFQADVACWHIASYRCDTEFSRYRGMVDIGQARTNQARFMSTRPSPTGRYPGHEYCFATGL